MLSWDALTAQVGRTARRPDCYRAYVRCAPTPTPDSLIFHRCAGGCEQIDQSGGYRVRGHGQAVTLGECHWLVLGVLV
jgi:hypothetical protein